MRSTLSILMLSLFTFAAVGCGGGVKSGVADAPDEPAPVLTPEEKKGEQEAARNAAGDQ